MKYILGKKVQMEQFFEDDGSVVPTTVIEVLPGIVTRLKTKSADGYDAVQVGFGTQKKERISNARLGQMNGLGVFRFLKEFRIKKVPGQDIATEEIKVGDTVDLSTFAKGDKLRITSTSKAKGFQGVVKRHGFHGGPRSHGQKHSEREPGSIGGGLRNRVPKGMRMAGRMGGDTVTLTNVKVVNVDTEKNLLFVKGPIAGRRGTVLTVIAQ